MRYFRKIDLFELLTPAKLITFVGAGGKTSLAEYLAREALTRGKRVALTTTTKIWAKEPYVTIGETGWRGSTERLVHVGKAVEQGKLTGLEPTEIAPLASDFDLVLVEGDGSKGKPLKYPADFEPVIPTFSDKVVVLAGLDALSGFVDEVVFRWEILSQVAHVSGRDPVSWEVFLRLFESDAMMKGVDIEKCLVVLNKYDRCTSRDEALKTADALRGRLPRTDIVVASTRFHFFYTLGDAPALVRSSALS